MDDQTRAAPVETIPYPSEVTREVGDATESGQLDLVALLRDQVTAAQDRIVDIEETLNPQIDANPDDKLLMEMLDYVSDARDALSDLTDLLNTMQQRDLGSS
jgi:hypothetical protein